MKPSPQPSLDSSDSPPTSASPATGLGWRLALLIVTGALAAALLISGGSRYRAAKHNSRILVEAEVFSVLMGARRELGWARGNRVEVLEDLYGELKAQGARYIAILDARGNPILDVGKAGLPLDPPVSLKSKRRGPPEVKMVGDGSLAHAYVMLSRPDRRKQKNNDNERRFLAMEYRSTASQNIVKGARRAMFLELSAALVLMIAASFFWRMSRKAERLAALMVEQRIQAQKQLERDRQLKTLGQMSAVLGHELKNPIAALKGHAQLLIENLEENHRAAQGANTILNEAVALQNLTEQVLEFARTGLITTSKVYLDDLAAEAVATAGCADVKVTAREGASWSMDRQKMVQALANLLTNARQAGEPSAPIELTLEAEANLSISVRDRGVGITRGEEKRMFEPFETTKPRGTGLGLALAKRIVESHGGTIVAANHPDGGAIFTIALPATSRHEQDQ